jgi:tripartite-type tricarboxylate transporter receptor subunit TctC
MTIRRREFLQMATGAALLPAGSSVVLGQAYPARPVRLMVGFAAGQAIDILARLIGQWLTDRLGQQFVVENRPGAGGNIAAEAVVRAPADGYTLLVIGANNAINATLYDNLGFNVIRDLVPVAGIYRVPQVMEVNPAFPAKSVPEFIAHAKANPGRFNFASAGVGSVAHVSGELFKMLAGVDMQHVPYRGAPPALADLIAGHVHVMFDNMPSSIEHIRSGRLRALGVSTPRRLDVLPDVPTIGEFVPGFVTMAFAGLGAPKDTPEEVVRILNREVNAGLADTALRTRILDLGGIPLPVSPAEFGKLLADETEKWMKVVKFSGAKAS